MQKDNAPALLAMSQAYVLLKQIPKARTQLKRLAKVVWSLAEAEDLEKSWLLLADIYCQGGKYDLASELLRRCVQYNKARRRSDAGRPGGEAGPGSCEERCEGCPGFRHRGDAEQERDGEKSVERGMWAKNQDWNEEHL